MSILDDYKLTRVQREEEKKRYRVIEPNVVIFVCLYRFLLCLTQKLACGLEK